MSNEDSRSNIIWIDNARAISCILVIVTHILGPWVYQLDHFGEINRFFIITFFTISKLCTPTFLMISGSLLIQKDYSDLTKHKLRIKRLFSSFMLWSLVYIVFYTFLNISRGKHYTIDTYSSFLKDSALHGAAYHLWFMYLIIGIYLCMPYLSILCKRVTKLQLIVFFSIWGISLIVNLLMDYNSNMEFISNGIGYLGYLFIGNLITKYNINGKIRIRYASIIFIFGVITTLALAYYQLSNSHTISSKTFHRLNINIAFVAIGFFMMIKSFMYENQLIKSISKHSLGIYYIHLFLIMLLNKIWLIQYSELMLIKLIIFSAITLIMCYLIIKYMEQMLSKIRIFRGLIIT